MTRKDLLHLIKESQSNNLKSINLSVNAITDKDLDETIISELMNFVEIDLSRNMLETLPNSFKKLKKLKKLILSENYFTEFSPEIIHLKNLEHLDLGANSLSTIPDNIKHLRKLKFLYLKNNPFKKIPEAIFKIKNLEALGLVNTKISAIPINIVMLQNLKNLWLGKNRIKELPHELINLANLEQITLDNNPLPIPQNVLKNSKNPQELFTHYKQFKEEQLEKTYEAKVVIIGESQAGKTSLLNRLVYNRFHEDEEKTENINIDNWIIHSNQNKIIKINLWDFGGQDILYSLHNFFLTDNCIFILVWDARNENQSKKIEYWLKAINKVSQNPQVLLVMNKIDEHITAINKIQLNKFCSNIHYFNISCKYDWGINELSKFIQNTLEKNDKLVYSYDKKIINLKKELLNIKKPYITLAQFDEIVKKYKVNYSSDYIKNIFIDLGVILYFKDNYRLGNYIILKINWFIQNVYSLINWIPQHNNDGSFQYSDLVSIFTNQQLTHEIKIFLIDALLGFDIVFEINKKFYFPNLLQFYDNDIEKITLNNYSKFKIATKNIDNYFFYKLIVLYSNSNKTIIFWRNVIQISDNEKTIFIYYDEQNEIYIYIENIQNKNISEQVQQILNEIRKCMNSSDIDVQILLKDLTYVSAVYLKKLQEFGQKEYITTKANRYIIDDIFKNFSQEQKVNNTTINNMYGDILGDEATKNIINHYGTNQKEFLEGITKLLVEIQNSNLENKETIIKEIQLSSTPAKVKSYLEELSNLSSIPANLMTIIQSLL